MRLIDADNMDFSKTNLNKSQMKAVLDFMDAQQTAYDVDKVVERLEGLKHPYTSFTERYGALNAYDYYIEKAKTIARKGGKDANTSN